MAAGGELAAWGSSESPIADERAISEAAMVRSFETSLGTAITRSERLSYLVGEVRLAVFMFFRGVAEARH